MPAPLSRAVSSSPSGSPRFSKSPELLQATTDLSEPAGLACLADVFVMLCDWRGRSTWTSGNDSLGKVGELIWEHLALDSLEQAKHALGQVVAIRVPQVLDVVHKNGDRIRGRLWPLDSPEIAVCLLGSRVPGNLRQLSQRERDVLDWLAYGFEPRSIAEKLDISISTIHTHLKHAREKLALPTLESLISFAARYCYPMSLPFEQKT